MFVSLLRRRVVSLTAGGVIVAAGVLASAVPAAAAEATWGLHNYNQPGGVEHYFGWGSTDSCTALTGDWDGNGTDTPGAVCPNANGTWQWVLHNYNAAGGVEYNFAWGSTSCLPLTGDWDGNGSATVGTVCGGGSAWQWGLHNYNQAGGVEYAFSWGGTSGCWPIVGDWNGDRKRTPGLVCPEGGAGWRWVMHDYNQAGGVEHHFSWGGTACPPIWGDWDGNGTETPGLVCTNANNTYQWVLHNYNAAGAVEANFGWGSAAQKPITGDWDGNGTTTVGTTTLGTTGSRPPGGYSLPLPRGNPPRGEYDDPHHDYPAIDLGAPTGTDLYAVVSGTITHVSDTKCGIGIRLTSSAHGAYFTYCHLSARRVGNGVTVAAGQLIGLVGNTGNSTAPHLHFAITTGSTKRCPQTWLLAIYDGRTPPTVSSLPTSGCTF